MVICQGFLTLIVKNETISLKYMNNKILSDVIGETPDVIFCGLAPDKESLMMQHYYANPHDKFWRVLHQFHFTDKQIKTSLDPLERQENYEYLISKNIGLCDNFDELISKVKELKPKVLAFNGKKAAELYLNRAVEYGELKKDKIGKTRVYVLPSTAGSANANWNIRYWRELKTIIKK